MITWGLLMITWGPWMGTWGPWMGTWGFWKASGNYLGEFELFCRKNNEATNREISERIWKKPSLPWNGKYLGFPWADFNQILM